MALLGLDIGTTGVKATVFDIEGNEISYAYHEYNLDYRENRCELNPKTIFEVVKLVMKNAIGKVAPVHIKAICASSIGEAFVLLDKNGCELTNRRHALT
jgi:sugar (pentulose or hexulose) kinase